MKARVVPVAFAALGAVTLKLPQTRNICSLQTQAYAKSLTPLVDFL